MENTYQTGNASTLAHAGGTSTGEPQAVGLEYKVTLG